MSDELVHLSGIHASTGDYLVQPFDIMDLLSIAQGKRGQLNLSEQLKRGRRICDRPGPRHVKSAVHHRVRPELIRQAGWAVVFPEDSSPEIERALKPLIEHRRLQTGKRLFQRLKYLPGESHHSWLKDRKVFGSDVVPWKIPYYVLLVGSPEQIPFDFQYQLDANYAVGRLDFDHPDHYAQYAESVVRFELDQVANRKEAVFWGTRHPNDEPSELFDDYLTRPLLRGDEFGPPVAEEGGLQQTQLLSVDATQANLLGVLHRDQDEDVPAMLFTASHGLGWPQPDTDQYAQQGSLLCQDWEGPTREVGKKYISADLISDDARVSGMVVFMYACYGLGTPEFDNFLMDNEGQPQRIADKPFIAALPKRLLSHPNGSALAVIGHIERAWSCSFKPYSNDGSHLGPFSDFLARMLRGEPLGHAMEGFSDRYLTLSAELCNEMDPSKPPTTSSARHILWKWIVRNDAQNYILLGDPAVQLRVDR